MSITVNVNGKAITIKANNTFGDLFDDSNAKGKFQEYEFTINGQINSQITKATKLNSVLSQQVNEVTMMKKGATPSVIIEQNTKKEEPDQFTPGAFPGTKPIIPPSTVPKFGAFPTPGPNPSFPTPPSFIKSNSNSFGNTQPNSQTPTGNPSYPTPTPPPSFGNFQPQPQPPNPNPEQNTNFPSPPKKVPQFNAPQSKRKTFEKLPQISESIKQIKNIQIQIIDDGMTVVLDIDEGELKAVFREQDAIEANVDEIKGKLTPNLLETDPGTISKVVVGKEGQATKVLFLKGFVGLAIQWATGVLTYFEFSIEK